MTFDDFDTQAQCEEFYTDADYAIEECASTHPSTGESFYCAAKFDGECDNCGTCDAVNCDDDDGQPSWEQEWEDFGEVGCESIEYL